MLLSLKLRITHDNVDDFKNVESLFLEYIRVKELGSETGKYHFHYFLKTDKSIQTIRNYIVKELKEKNDLKGNGLYSISKLNEEYPLEYLSYLMKEDNNPFIINIPNKVLDDLKVYIKDLKEEMEKNKLKKKLKKEKKVWKIIIEEYDLKPFDDGFGVNKVVKSVIDYHKKEELVIRDHAIRSYTLTIACHLSPKFRELYEDKIVHDLLK